MNGFHITLIGILIVALGTFLSFYGQLELRKQDSQKAKKEANEESQKVKDQAKEDKILMLEKFQEIMAAIGAAKKEESLKMVDEKITIIQRDFQTWAADFAESRQDRQREFNAARRESENLELSKTEKARPVFAFAMRVLEESVKAYSAKTGEKLEVNSYDLPINFFEGSKQPRQLLVSFKGGSKWFVGITANRPATEDRNVCLMITTQSRDGGTGVVMFWVSDNLEKFYIEHLGELPLQNLKPATEEFPLHEAQAAARSFLTRLLEAQLLTED